MAKHDPTEEIGLPFKELCRGGFGSIFDAGDGTVFKVLIAKEGLDEDHLASNRYRFEVEAETLRLLQHCPNVIRIHPSRTDIRPKHIVMTKYDGDLKFALGKCVSGLVIENIDSDWGFGITQRT
jgi:hypothetical protein